MPQHQHVADPEAGAVVDEQLVPVAQRRDHGRSCDLGHSEGQEGPLQLALLRQLRHPRHLPGSFLHQSQSDPGLLS
ncbi:hypothetical protein SBD_4038 [Streptomyces bottropensis ATCC 25435]|uniref:Uncharacterized protein n=1 Tax=Streptomyces bottropensis ATCC 25435 TaxID=1054862 RepID=M3FN44_9ACTN|nr:hypothetical protein SBD_4038 [Streptomyces bottropensis ATCC 25435]